MAVYKQPGGVEDLTFGMGTEQQQRQFGIAVITQVNSGYIPFNENRSVEEELLRQNTVDIALRRALDNTVGIGDVFTKPEHVNISNGAADAGKPVVLDGTGSLHPTISGNGTYPVGQFTPTAPQEYPDASDEEVGAYWGITGLLEGVGYTFVGGSLVGQTIYNNDILINGSDEWIPFRFEITSGEFYRLDGTTAIIAPFAGGGQQVKNIAGATEIGDAIEYSQLQQLSDAVIRKDGTVAMEAGLSLGSNKLLDVAVGTEATDGINKSQLDGVNTGIQDHINNTANPHGVTAAQVGALPLTRVGTAPYVGKIETDDTLRIGYYNDMWRNCLHFKDVDVAYAGADGTSYTLWDDRNVGPTRGEVNELFHGAVAIGKAEPLNLVTTPSTVVAMGSSAMANMTHCITSIAMGSSAMANTIKARDNIAIGDSALKNVQARTENYDQDQQQGTRNTALGGNAGYFLNEGVANVFIGRNAGQPITDMKSHIFIGNGAGAGFSPIGFSGEIENWSTRGNTDTAKGVAIGTYAIRSGLPMSSVAVGGYALNEAKYSEYNVAIGGNALKSVDKETWYNGGVYIPRDDVGTYDVQTNGDNYLYFSNPHGCVVGDIVIVQHTGGALPTFQNDKPPAVVIGIHSTTTVIVNYPDPPAQQEQGPAHLYGIATGVQAETYNSNTAVGYNALGELFWGRNNTAVGKDALVNSISGGYVGGFNNCSGIGSLSRISADNQVQLGDSACTAYAYGAVQDRSDYRDKTDIRSTFLGLDFIDALRPVDFKRDYRENYYNEVEEMSTSIDADGLEETETRVRQEQYPSDGSKAGSRYHHGLIAQEVQAVIADTGVDFGGFQDHSMGGGEDVLSIGYTEFIGPMIKAIQELKARIEVLEAL